MRSQLSRQVYNHGNPPQKEGKRKSNPTAAGRRCEWEEEQCGALLLASSRRLRLSPWPLPSLPRLVFLFGPRLSLPLAMKTDENGWKNLISTSVFIFFLAETGSGSENTGTETGSGYAEVRKQTDTDVEPERITRSNILEYTLTKSQNNIHVRSY